MSISSIRAEVERRVQEQLGASLIDLAARRHKNIKLRNNDCRCDYCRARMGATAAVGDAPSQLRDVYRDSWRKELQHQLDFVL